MTTSAELEEHDFRFKEKQPPWRSVKLTDSCSLQCAACEGIFRLSEWKLEKDSIECELCGEHDGIFCPGCEEGYNNMHDTSHLRVIP